MPRASATGPLLWALLPLAAAWCAQRDVPPAACTQALRAPTPLARAACAGAPEELPAAARLLFGHGLDPATASLEDWTLLPGIGPARAAAIVALRERGVAFERPEDLERVHGIGPVTVARLRPWLRAGPGGAASGPVPPPVAEPRLPPPP